MSIQNLVQMAAFAMTACLFVAGCASDPNKMGLTNPNQPGPAAGRVVGGTVGGVAGNAAGFVAGVGEGVAATTGAVFNNRTYVVRKWETITTSDGRTVQVPVDIVVDENGVPLQSPPKTPAQNVETLSGKAKQN